MSDIAREMRTAAAWPDVTPCMKNDALERGADVIEALVDALDSIAAEMRPLAARKHTRYAGLHWAITEADAALALARKGG